MGLLDSIRRVFGRGRAHPPSPSSVEELRAAFRTRYHHFKLLLSANNKALEIMADMERAVHGSDVFGMSFVRSRATAVSVSVFQIVKNLDVLAPGEYAELHARFLAIQGRVNALLAERREAAPGPFVIPLSAIDKESADQVGSKMANVGEVRNRIGLPVPNGFAMTAAAYQRFMEANDLQAEIDRRLQAASVEQMDELFALSADLQRLITRAPVPEDVAEAIGAAYRRLEAEEGGGVTVSLRSSALAEDTAGVSFAGQYRSVLNVLPENLLDAYREVLASKYSLQAVAYREARGIRDEDVAMCVGCMVMAHSESGGVMYSRNPVNIRDDAVVINSVWGLPQSVVDGSVAPDLFVVSRGPEPAVSRRVIRLKERRFDCDPVEGVCRLNLTGEAAEAPSLSDEQAVALARMAMRLEEAYGSPQDIEWAVVRPGGGIVILQCRPLEQVETAGRGVEAPKVVDAPLLLSGGVTASPGVGAGPVFIARKDLDALRFPDGAVLVTQRAFPRWAALLSRASALVTEKGSITGHLANVAREFRVPAVMLLPGAVSALESEGDVTVDADGRRIYRGRVEELLSAARSEAPNLMAGSPVLELLRKVMDCVTPLTLVDPESPDFRPAKVQTLHDITRFAHEKSIHEMFNFGKAHHFSERAAKQIVARVPMQWWVINLDDGFTEDVEGKFVDLKNIACIPMLALWEGIVAVPWAGPPPVDTRGLMSILVEATANPALEAGAPSAYADRNYFMISRNFCSLHSRFGFHYSTVEALVSERAPENYISFGFKGGAADLTRRLRRAVFVGEVLSEFGFRVRVQEDAVFARLSGQEQEFMRERLRVLGYLIIHTRQLDMIMHNAASIREHKEKMMRDMETLASRCAEPSPIA